MSLTQLFRRLLVRAVATRKTSPIRRTARPLDRAIERLEDRTVPSQIGLEATDLLVNTGTTGQQGAPRVAMKPDGTGFVVVWQGPDGGGGSTPDSGIFAQRYDANWQKIGSEIAVNTTLAEQQYEPAVAVDASGNFVVAWTSRGQAGGAGRDVVMRRFDPTGAPLSAETFVNTTTASEQSLPSVAMNAAGAFVVTWASGSFLAENVFARVYNSSGTAVTGEVAVNTTTADEQSNNDVAIDTSGNFVVAWNSFDQVAAGSKYDIFARRFNASGAPTTSETQVNTTTTDNQQQPRLAVDSASGNVTIVWQGENTAGGSGFDVVQRRFNSSLAALTGETLVNQTTANAQTHADIDMTAAGNYVVTWENNDASAIGDISARLYDATGSPTSAELTVNLTTSGDQEFPAVGINAAGDYVVAFQGTPPASSDTDVYLRRFGEAPVVSFSSAASSPGEQTATSPYTVQRTAAQYVIANVATVVSVTRTSGTAAPGTDFTTSFPQTVTIVAGSTSQAASVSLVNDSIDEADETIDQGIGASSNYTIGTPSSRTITIVDDDPPPTISINDVSVTEGNSGTTVATFTVSLSAASGQTITVNFATANGTATAGSDYVANTGTLTFAPGVTTQTITVTVNGDTLDEANETFFVNLSGPTNATIVDGQGVGTLTDDDPAPSVSINSVSVTEGDSGTTSATFTASLSAPSGQTVTVNFATANGTAVAGTDYNAASGTLTFAPLQTSQTITVQVIGNTVFQANRQFSVTLSSPTNATIATGTGTGTINDDDAPAAITVSSGNNQSANVGQNFASPLVALVRNANNNPVQGVSVTYTAPAAGASAVFSTTTNTITVTSNASGLASTGTFAANATPGANYTVTATATGGSNPSVNFTLTNNAVLTATLDGSGNLVIDDTAGNDNDLTAVVSGANLVITDASEQFAPTSIPGATRSNGNRTLTVPFASITGTQVIVNTGGGDDALTLDYSGGNFPRSIALDGGSPAVAPGDRLVLLRGTSTGLFTAITHTFVNNSAGSVSLDPDGPGGAAASVVTYAGLEPVTDNLDADVRVFNFTGAAETITVTDTGGADGMSTIDSTLGESVNFANPTVSLTIDTATGAAAGDDTVTITSIDAAYRASTTITAKGGDTFSLNANLTLGSATAVGTFNATAGAINLNANITTDGNGVPGFASVVFTGNTVLGANVVLDTDAPVGVDGSIRFTGTVNADNVANNRTLQLLAGAGTVTTGDVGGTAPLGSLSVTAFLLTAGAIATTGGVTVNVSSTVITSAITGAISGAAATLVKQGGGTLTLTGTNTYGGATTVSAGTLLVNGTNSGAGAVAVNNSATLGGTGTIGGAVTVNAGGSITGGTLGGIGTLTVGSLTFNGGTYRADFNGNTADRLAVGGAVDLGSGAANGTFTVNSQSGTATGGTVFRLIDNTGGGGIANSPFTGAAESGAATINAAPGVFTYAGGNGNDFIFVATGPANVTLPGGDNSYTLARETGPGGIDNLVLRFTGGAVIDARPTAAVTTYTVTGTAANETLTIDYTASGGYFQRDVTFAGGGGFDALNVAGGAFGTIAYDYANANDGFIRNFQTPGSGTLLNTIAYTGLEPITNTGTATDIVFDLPGTADATVTLGDIGGGQARLDSTIPTFEQTDFNYPVAGGSITLNLGANDQTFAVNTLALNANTALTVNGDGGADVVTLAGTGALAVTGVLSVTAETINQTNAVTVTGTTTLAAGAGGITLANAGNDFPSVTASATDTGAITISDTAGLVVTSATTADGAITLTTAGGDLTLTTVSAGGTGDVTGNATGGNILAGDVSAAGNVVALTTDGTIDELGADAAADITALSAALTAGTGVAAAADPFHTAVTNLAATTSTGGVFLTNAGALTIAAVGTVTGVTVTGASGDIAVVAANALTAGALVSGPGTIALTAGASAVADDNLSVGANVTSTGGGTVTLTSGDSIFHTAGTISTTGAGIVRFTADSEGAGGDGARGGITQKNSGSLTAPAAVFRSGNAVDYASTTNDLGTVTAVVTVAGQGFSYRDATDLEVDTVDGLDGVTTTNGGITLRAGDDLTFTAVGDVQSDGGNVTLAGDADGSGAGAVTMDQDTAVTAGTGTIAASAAGNVTLGDLTTTNATAAAVGVTSTAGAILDAGTDADAEITAAAAGAEVTLSAATGIGSADAIDTQVVILSATNATSGNIRIAEADGITLKSVVQTTAADANDIFVTAATGNITVVTINNVGNTAGDVDLTATAGSLLDDNTDPPDPTLPTRITGDVLTLRAVNTIGAPLVSAVEDLDTDAVFVDAETTAVGANNGIWVADAGSVTFDRAITADGVVVLDAATGLVARAITAGGAGRNVRLQTTASGNVTLGAAAGDAVTAAGDIVRIQAVGAVVDGNGAGTNVTALSFSATGAGVGAAVNPVETDVTNLAAEGNTGGVFVTDASDLTVTSVTAFGVPVVGVTATGVGAIGLTAATSLTAQSVVTTAAGSIGLTATTAGIAVNAGVTSGSGPIAATAGATITEGAGGRFGTSGTLTTGSAGGQFLDGTNAVGGFDATNSTGGPVNLTNTAANLNISRVSQTGGGVVRVANTGAFQVTTNGVTADGGAVSLSAGGGSATINAGVSTLGAGAINLTTTGGGNPIAVNAPTTTGSGTITATAGGAITQTGGMFGGGSLAATSAGGQDLDGANAVAAFTAVNAGGNVLLTNAAPTLTVNGVAQTAGGNTALTNAGAVAVAGGVNGDGVGLTANGGAMTIGAGVTANTATVGLTTTGAGNPIAVNAVVTAATAATAAAGGAITQAGGAFLAPSLTATSAGGQSLGGGNAVSTFAASNTGTGGLSLNNTVALTLVGVSQQAASQPLTISNGNAVSVAGVVGAANGPITITSVGNFTADVTDPATAARVPDASTPLLDAGAGSILVVTSAEVEGQRGGTVRLASELRGMSAQFGQPGGIGANVGANVFDMQLSRNVDIQVFGNNPVVAPGDSIFPQVKGIGVATLLLVVEEQTGQSIRGRYEATFVDNVHRVLRFAEIESFDQLGFRAAVVQTGPTDYSVRATAFQGTQPINASIDGQGLRPNPFVVSPSLISPNATFSAPTVAFGDVNGDGNPDMVLGSGANDAPLVTIIDGVSLARGRVRLDQLTPETGLLAQFYAYAPTFRGGMSVAVADFNGDGWAEIVTGAGNGGGAHVRMFGLLRDFATQPLGTRIDFSPAVPQVSIGGVGLGSMANFLPFGPTFRGGVNVATGDVNGDGTADLIIGAGVGGAPRVMVFSGADGQLIQNFFAYGEGLRGGVLVAGGNFDGASGDEIVVGPGYGGAPHIKVYGFVGGQPALLASFFAFDFDPNAPGVPSLQVADPNATSGVGSVAFGVPDGSGRQELLVSTARGPRLQMRRYNLSSTSVQDNPNLFQVLTVGSVATPGAFAILDPLTGRPLTESEFSDGGMVGGIVTAAD